MDFDLSTLEGTTIRFTKEDMVELIFEKQSGYESKYIKFEDFFSAIDAAREKRTVTVPDDEFEPILSPILPKNCVQLKQVNEHTYWVVIEKGPSRFDFDYYETIYNIPLPRLLFAFRVYKNILTGGGVVAVKDHTITEETELFCYPFSNASHGHICWGNATPQIKTLYQLSGLPEMFLAIPNSNHSYGNNESGLEYRPFLEKLSKEKTFDNDVLKDEEMTYGEWVASFK